MNDHDTIDELFEQLGEAFDRASPPSGHRERFQARLERGNGDGNHPRRLRWWKPLSIAASVVILLGASLFFIPSGTSMEEQVAEIAPEASETTQYFSSVVEQQVRELEQLGNPETQPLVDATLGQLQQLEADYQKLVQDLIDGGNSKLILSAMITNFQTRIDLLEDVMQQIKKIKEFKNNNDENTV